MNIKEELEALKIDNVGDDDRYDNYVCNIINNILDDFSDEVGTCVDLDDLNQIIDDNIDSSTYVIYTKYHYTILQAYPFNEYQLDLNLGDYKTLGEAAEAYARKSLAMSIANSEEINDALALFSYDS